MLVAGLLVALRVGQGPVENDFSTCVNNCEPVQPACTIPNFPLRYTGFDYTFCASTQAYPTDKSEIYHNDATPCAVAASNARCCVNVVITDLGDNLVSMCLDPAESVEDENTCTAREGPPFQWCPNPTTTTTATTTARKATDAGLAAGVAVGSAAFVVLLAATTAT